MYITLNTEARRVATPPQKSPAPQTSADANPNITEVSSLVIRRIVMPLVPRVEGARCAVEYTERNSLRIFSTVQGCASRSRENSRDSWASRTRIGIHRNWLHRSWRNQRKFPRRVQCHASPQERFVPKDRRSGRTNDLRNR